MPLSISCPGCQAKYRVPDEAAGKMVACKACGVKFKVEATAPAPPPEQPPIKKKPVDAAPPPKPKPPARDEDEDEEVEERPAAKAPKQRSEFDWEEGDEEEERPAPKRKPAAKAPPPRPARDDDDEDEQDNPDEDDDRPRRSNKYGAKEKKKLIGSKKGGLVFGGVCTLLFVLGIVFMIVSIAETASDIQDFGKEVNKGKLDPKGMPQLDKKAEEDLKKAFEKMNMKNK